MATKAELEAILAKRLSNKDLNNANFGDIKDALKSLSPQETSDLVTAVQNQNTDRIGVIIFGATKRVIKAATDAEATLILADDNMDLEEIERVFI